MRCRIKCLVECAFFDRVFGMSRKMREWQPDASWLFPPSPRDWLPEGHLVYCLLDVTTQIDISPIVDDYSGKDGSSSVQPPFHPRMMLVLL